MACKVMDGHEGSLEWGLEGPPRQEEGLKGFPRQEDPGKAHRLY